MINYNEEEKDTGCSDQLERAEAQLHESDPFDPPCRPGAKGLEWRSRTANLVETRVRQAFQSASDQDKVFVCM